MTAGFTSPVGSRSRRRKESIPVSMAVFDYLALFLLALLPVVTPWVFGGNRLWIMGPVIVFTVIASILGLSRFFISSFRRDWVIPPGGWILLAFMAYLLLILPFAEVRYDAAMETMRFLSYVLAYWFWTNLLRNRHRWKLLLGLFMLSASLMAWYALIQEVRGTSMVLNVPRPEQYGMRASGSYICPNHFAHLMQMTALAGAGLVLCPRAGLALRLFAGYAALISLPALYLTESRSGMIGLMLGAVSMVVAVSIRKGAIKFLLVLLVAPLLAAGIGWAAWRVSPMLQERVAQALEGDVRLVIWKDSLPIAMESPVVGSGLGSYRWMYPHFRNHLTANADPEFVHNDYLHYWSEFGAVGLFLIALVVGAIIRRALQVIRDNGDSGDVYMMGGMLGMMAGSFAHAFFDFNFHIFANTHVFIFIISAMLCALSDYRYETVASVTPPWCRWMGIALAVLLAIGSVVYGRALVSYGYVLAAESRVGKLQWDEAQVFYEKAMTWAPRSWRAHIGYAHLLRSRSFWVRDRELKSRWLDLSRRHYERSMAMNPWEADALYGLSGVFKMSGDQAKALEYRRKVVEMVPRHVFYLNELGLQLKDMGQYEEALEVYKQSWAVEPNPPAERNIRWLGTRIAEAR